MQPSYDLALEDQIRECFGRVVYTHKTHERMADRCSTTLARYKLVQIALTALTSAGAIGVVFGDEFWIEVATVICSVVTVFASTYLKNFDPGGAAQQHRDAAAQLWNVRECYFSLLTDLPKLTREDAIAQRDELQASLAALYLSAPRTNGKAYKEAQDRLKNMEDMTFSDEEIDSFLPLSLKRSSGRPKLE
ncbi:MAG: SLATT domain-containing protein [Pseudomonadota bacterium]